jgi:hypothetical protein
VAGRDLADQTFALMGGFPPLPAPALANVPTLANVVAVARTEWA